VTLAGSFPLQAVSPSVVWASLPSLPSPEGRRGVWAGCAGPFSFYKRVQGIIVFLGINIYSHGRRWFL
jgi:hypothetical protein